MASNNRELIIIVIFIYALDSPHLSSFCELLNRGLVSLVDTFFLLNLETSYANNPKFLSSFIEIHSKTFLCTRNFHYEEIHGNL